MEKVMLPLGIEKFKDMRIKEYYYVDKTELIKIRDWIFPGKKAL